MDTKIESILKEICREYQCDESFILPTLKILQSNFFFKLRDIKNIDFALWRNLNLPINLFFILQGKLSMCEPTKINPFATTTEPLTKEELTTSETVDTTKPKKDLTQQTIKSSEPVRVNQTQISSVKLDYPTQEKQISSKESESSANEKLKHQTYEILDDIRRDIGDIVKTREIFKLLHNVVCNILSNPDEKKFRRVNIGAIMKKYPYKKILYLLELFSFTRTEDSEQHLELNGSIDYLNKCTEYFNHYLIEKKIAESTFNPYATSLVSRGTDPSKLSQVEESVDFEELIRREKNRRADIISNEKLVERRPKIFKITSEGIGSLLNDLNTEFEQSQTKIEEDESYKIAMRTLKNSLQSDRFKLKSRTEYENLIKTPIYTKADIRIKFPNEIILEGIFLLRETIGDIHNFIKDCLINPNEKFYLSTSPPLKRYTNLSATIQSLGLYPSTLLYINFPEIDFMKGEHSGNFLKPEVIEKLKQNF